MKTNLSGFTVNGLICSSFQELASIAVLFIERAAAWPLRLVGPKTSALLNFALELDGFFVRRSKFYFHITFWRLERTTD